MSSGSIEETVKLCAETAERDNDTDSSFTPKVVRPGKGSTAFVLADWAGLTLISMGAFAVAGSSGIRQLLSWPPLFLIGNTFGSVACISIYAAVAVSAAWSRGLYRSVPVNSIIDEALIAIKAALFATLLLVTFLYVDGSSRISPLALIATMSLGACWLLLMRELRSVDLARGLEAGRGMRNALIVGTGRMAQKLAKEIESRRRLGYLVQGFLDDHRNGDPRVIGTFDELPMIVRSHFIDDVFVTLPVQPRLMERLVLEASKYKVNVKVVPEFFEIFGAHAPIEYTGDFPVIAVHSERKPHLQLRIKRAIDVIASAIGVVLIAPILCLIACMVMIDSPGPVFYRSERVGHKGRVFHCWKFRTMVSNAESLLESLMHLNEREQILFKVSNDPRLTRIGRFLRRYSLDELPQLFNVLVGEMSLVGPRPPTVREYNMYQLEHLRRLEVVPGMTGLWQVSGRTEPSFDTYLKYDLEYVEKWSLWLDLHILVKTVPTVLSGTGC